MKFSRRKFIKNGILSLIGLSFLEAFWFEKYVINWNYFDISRGRKDKIRVIQLSDLHIQSIKYFHKSITKRINKTQPDFILFTGDTVDKQQNLYVLEAFLKLLDNTIPKVAITGNWEYWGKVNLHQLSEIFKKYNGTLLINQSSSFNLKNQTISFIGLDDFLGGNPNLARAIENTSKNGKKIALIHCPEYTDTININNFDLILSGHTHGGQFNFFGFVPFKPKGSGSYLKGWYKDSKMYVSKGIGTSILPFRFGARAEVVEFEI